MAGQDQPYSKLQESIEQTSVAKELLKAFSTLMADVLK
jgi:hypothetical protein